MAVSNIRYHEPYSWPRQRAIHTTNGVVVEIGYSYERDNSGPIERIFTEEEWNKVCRGSARFNREIDSFGQRRVFLIDGPNKKLILSYN